jgi:dephospho-CoA kinase
MRRGVVGLVGVTGFAGAGKTTAVDYLSSLTSGRVIYLGQTVLDEIRARGLSETRDNERQVRIELRRDKGPAALAMLCVDLVSECLGRGIPVFVDAIFMWEEFDLLASRAPNGCARLLAIDASFSIRSARLACRSQRPFTVDELRRRDETEEELGTGAVLAAAKHSIRNEDTFDEFYRGLAAFVSSSL